VFASLRRGGRMAVLVGDVRHTGELFSLNCAELATTDFVPEIQYGRS
jgi:hypothetical protein